MYPASWVDHQVLRTGQANLPVYSWSDFSSPAYNLCYFESGIPMLDIGFCAVKNISCLHGNLVISPLGRFTLSIKVVLPPTCDIEVIFIYKVKIINSKAFHILLVMEVNALW